MTDTLRYYQEIAGAWYGLSLAALCLAIGLVVIDLRSNLEQNSVT